MKLSQEDKSLLFYSTELPDVFFTDYLSEASGDNIKVFLHILFQSKYNSDFNMSDVSKSLGLDFNVVQDSFKYWEDKGILLKKPDGYVVKNLQEIELNKLYSPKVTMSPEQSIKTSENKFRENTIQNINKQFFQNTMSPSWYNDISFWFEKYKFEEEVMFALFNYCFENHALHRNYVQTVAEDWSNKGVHSFYDLDLLFQKQDKKQAIGKDISKKLNLYRNLTSFEEEYVSKWVDSYNYNMDIINLALKKSTSSGSVNFKYIDKVITDWHEKDLRTPQEVEAYIESTKPVSKREPRSSKVSKETTSEYTQSTFDSLYDN